MKSLILRTAPVPAATPLVAVAAPGLHPDILEPARQFLVTLDEQLHQRGRQGPVLVIEDFNYFSELNADSCLLCGRKT